MVLIPQWKAAAFYPIFMDFIGTRWLRNKWVCPGKNIFRRGADATTCFGPDFAGNIEIYLFDFSICASAQELAAGVRGEGVGPPAH